MKPSMVPSATTGPRPAPVAVLSAAGIGTIHRLSECGRTSRRPCAAEPARGGEDERADFLGKGATGGATADQFFSNWTD
jgi:hypothetical protein